MNRTQRMGLRWISTFWLLAQTTAAFAASPVATGDTSRPECVDAMAFARATYVSTAARLYAPDEIPEGLQSTLVLGNPELDAFIESSDAFEKVDRERRSIIYWAKEIDGGRRIVVEVGLGFWWSGDTYSLYLLDETISQSTFLDSLAAGNDTRAVPVIQGSWRPPLIFQRDDNGAKWFIDVGQPYEVLADWRVHTAAESRPLCTITFHPAAQNPIELLPKSVRTLADKLNEALGPENDEGEPHPTSRLRVVTQHVLANAALRPWALSDNDAYNSRTEVDDGLASWAQANRKRQRLHREMLRVYPVAERSLAAYYARTFGLPQPKAQEVAAWALDLIFRSYFVFSNGAHYFRYDGVRTNPWPMNP